MTDITARCPCCDNEWDFDSQEEADAAIIRWRSTSTPTYDDDEFLDDDRLVIPQPEFVQRDPMRRPRTPRATATPTPDATDAGSREALLRLAVRDLHRWDVSLGFGALNTIIGRLDDALAGPSTPTTEGLDETLRQLRDHGYQPMYNGRPSCPFCHNFVDAEETHRTDCLLVARLGERP